MYEIELRALVDDFEAIKSRLDDFAKPVGLGEREVTIFFFNPHQKDFDLRLRMKKDRCFLSFKEGSHKAARKIGLANLLSKEKLDELNDEYRKKIDFDKIKIDDLLDYVNGRKDSLKFI